MKTLKEFLNERVKMGDTKGLVNYKAKDCEFKKGDEVRIPVAYHTPYDNDDKIHTSHTIGATFSRQGEKFHHVKVGNDEVAVPKHHIFPTDLSGKNYKESQ